MPLIRLSSGIRKRASAPKAEKMYSSSDRQGPEKNFQLKNTIRQCCFNSPTGNDYDIILCVLSTAITDDESSQFGVFFFYCDEVNRGEYRRSGRKRFFYGIDNRRDQNDYNGFFFFFSISQLNVQRYR